MTCPYCQEFARRGITEPLVALDYQMLVNNLYVKFVLDTFGYDEGSKLTARIAAQADEIVRQGQQ